MHLIAAEDYILTAAHCVDGAHEITAIAGDHSLSEDEGTEQKSTTHTTAIHDDWHPFRLDNDIAILELHHKFTLNEYVDRIQRAREEPAVGEVVTVIGWGLDSDSASEVSDVLREVDVPVLDDAVPEDYYGGGDFSTKICIDSTGGHGSCNVREHNFFRFHRILYFLSFLFRVTLAARWFSPLKATTWRDWPG